MEKGLSRLLAFLREEEERERLEEIERLKPIGTPVGAYLEYRSVVFDLTNRNDKIALKRVGQRRRTCSCYGRYGMMCVSVFANACILVRS